MDKLIDRHTAFQLGAIFGMGIAVVAYRLSPAHAIVESVRRSRTPRRVIGVDQAKLLNSPDARLWAEEFMRAFGHRREAIDFGLMAGWFANAMQTGQLAHHG